MKGYRTYIVAALVAASGVLATTDWVSFLNNPQAGLVALGSALLMALMRSITNTPHGSVTQSGDRTNSFAPLAILFAASMAAAPASCSQRLETVDARIRRYAPIIGKDLLLVADILVQAECSPLAASTTAVAGNVLKIVASNSTRAAKVQNVLAANLAIAQQVCPLAQSIEATVGSVPAGRPAQVIPATATGA